MDKSRLFSVYYLSISRINRSIYLIDPTLKLFISESKSDGDVTIQMIKTFLSLIPMIPRNTEIPLPKDDIIFWNGMSIRWNTIISLLQEILIQKDFLKLVDLAIDARLMQIQKNLNVYNTRKTIVITRAKQRRSAVTGVDPNTVHEFSDGAFSHGYLNSEQLTSYCPDETPKEDNVFMNFCNPVMVIPNYVYGKIVEYSKGMKDTHLLPRHAPLIRTNTGGKLTFVRTNTETSDITDYKLTYVYSNTDFSHNKNLALDEKGLPNLPSNEQDFPSKYLFYAIENIPKEGSYGPKKKPVAISMWSLFETSSMYGKYALLEIWCLHEQTRKFIAANKNKGAYGRYGTLALDRPLLDIYNEGYRYVVLEVLDLEKTAGANSEAKSTSKRTIDIYNGFMFEKIQDLETTEVEITTTSNGRKKTETAILHYQVLGLNLTSEYIKYHSIQRIFNGDITEKDLKT